MSYAPIILLTLSALIAIANLCISIETWLRRRSGTKIKYSNVPFASLACGCLVWAKARGTFGWWAFVPALLDPGTWAIIPLVWNYCASRMMQAQKERALKKSKKRPG
jgi:hypothetical protein